MDLAVVLIKIRDYLLWFGPVYLVAICLGATVEVSIRRFFNLPCLPGKPKDAPKGPKPAKIGPIESNLLFDLWWRFGASRGRTARGLNHIPLRLFVWLATTSHSLSWLTLLLTAALSWPIALARLGFALILASLLSTLAPFLVSDQEVRFRTPRRTTDAPSTSFLVEWWNMVKSRFMESSNDMVLGAGAGALLIGLAPGLYSWVDQPLSYVVGAGLGVLLPLLPGTDAPLLAAMQTKGVEPGAIAALILAVSATPWSLLRLLKGKLGVRAAVLYVIAVCVLAALLALAFSPIISAAGLI